MGMKCDGLSWRPLDESSGQEVVRSTLAVLLQRPFLTHLFQREPGEASEHDGATEDDPENRFDLLARSGKVARGEDWYVEKRVSAREEEGSEDDVEPHLPQLPVVLADPARNGEDDETGDQHDVEGGVHVCSLARG